MSDKVFVKDVGNQIILETGEDISTGSEYKLLARNPVSKKVLYLSAALGGTTQIVHIKNANTFNVPGLWKMQGRVKFDGETYHTDYCWLTVEAIIS